MIDGVVLDVVVGLIACAVVLAGVAAFVRYHDAETIDEEEEVSVESETPEERQEAIEREHELFDRPANPESESYSE